MTSDDFSAPVVETCLFDTGFSQYLSKVRFQMRTTQSFATISIKTHLSMDWFKVNICKNEKKTPRMGNVVGFLQGGAPGRERVQLVNI